MQKKLVCYLQGQGHSEDLSKYGYLYFILQISDLFATRLGLIVHQHKLEYTVKNWIAAFKVKVIAKDQNVNE